MKLSVTQAEVAEGCLRWWRLTFREGFRDPSSASKTDGDCAHALTAHYSLTGEAPAGRVRMGTAVRRVIAAGLLPTPGRDLIVEERFDGQPKTGPDGRWLPLREETTLVLGGLPWDGFVDLQFRRAEWPEIWDHKFSSEPLTRSLEIGPPMGTIQMPVYAYNALRRWPDAPGFRLVHHYAPFGPGLDPFLREQPVTRDQVLERAGYVAALVDRMKSAAAAPRVDDVPVNLSACHAGRGCPHQSRCSAYRRSTVPMSNLSREELEMFGFAPPPESPPAAPAVPPAPVSDTMNQLRADDAAAEIVAPPPTASAPKPQPPPACPDCGTTFTPENVSRLRSGDTKHVGCPLAPAEPAPKAAEPLRTAAEAVVGQKYRLPAGAVATYVGPDTSGFLFEVRAGVTEVLGGGDNIEVYTEPKKRTRKAKTVEAPVAPAAPPPAKAPEGCDGGGCGWPCTKCGSEYGGACAGTGDGTQCPDGKRECECAPSAIPGVQAPTDTPELVKAREFVAGMSAPVPTERVLVERDAVVGYVERSSPTAPEAPDVAAGKDTSTGDDARFAAESPPPPADFVECPTDNVPCGTCGETTTAGRCSICAEKVAPARAAVAATAAGLGLSAEEATAAVREGFDPARMLPPVEYVTESPPCTHAAPACTIEVTVSKDGQTWETGSQVAARYGLKTAPEKHSVSEYLTDASANLTALVVAATEAGNLDCARDALRCLAVIRQQVKLAREGRLS